MQVKININDNHRNYTTLHKLNISDNMQTVLDVTKNSTLEIH
jgi:hypothetical protein